LFWFSNKILLYALILPVSQLQTQQTRYKLVDTYRIFNTYLLYSYANFVVEVDDKSSLNGGF